MAFHNKKWLMLQEEGAALVLEPGRRDGGTMFVQSRQEAAAQTDDRPSLAQDRTENIMVGLARFERKLRLESFLSFADFVSDDRTLPLTSNTLSIKIRSNPHHYFK
jgi:hypothetical protein